MDNLSRRSDKEGAAMFCNQCEQTVENGCTKIGVCGKNHEVAALQDLLTYAVRGLCHFAVSGRSVGIDASDINRFTMKAIFSTLTNISDPSMFTTVGRYI